MQTDHKNGSNTITRLSQNISYVCLTGEADKTKKSHESNTARVSFCSASIRD